MDAFTKNLTKTKGGTRIIHYITIELCQLQLATIKTTDYTQYYQVSTVSATWNVLCSNMKHNNIILIVGVGFNSNSKWFSSNISYVL
jgi:hypothetical protein